MLTGALEGKRGGHTLQVESADRIEPGGIYLLFRHNKGKADSLFEHVYDLEGVEIGSWIRQHPVQDFIVVTKIEGNILHLRTPLLHDVRPEWQPAVNTEQVLEEIGVEHLRIEFTRRDKYGGHHREAGCNAVFLTDLRHSWMRDIAIDNADSPILTGRSYNLTLRDLRITDRIGAHYGIHLGWGQDCRVRDLDVDAKALHSISVDTGARRCVYSRGRVRRAYLDQHCGINLQNLFGDIEVPDAEPGFSLFRHGGGREFFPLHGGFNTFWNIRLIFPDPARLDRPARIVGPGIPGPSARLVGMRGNAPIEITGYGPNAYIEGTNRDDLAVPSLYDYQFRNRLEKEP
jgi:hypothetical protein